MVPTLNCKKTVQLNGTDKGNKSRFTTTAVYMYSNFWKESEDNIRTRYIQL